MERSWQVLCGYEQKQTTKENRFNMNQESLEIIRCLCIIFGIFIIALILFGLKVVFGKKYTVEEENNSDDEYIGYYSDMWDDK